MTGPDASSGEMGRVSMPGRAGRDHDDVLDMILDRRPLPADAPAGMHVLADTLAGLAVAPDGGELPGQAAAMAAFARSAGSPAATLTLPLPGEPQRRQRRRLAAGRARLAASAAVIVVGLCGTAAAAYAGVLPAAVQNFAHHVIGAPAAHQADHRHGAPGQAGNPGAGQPSPSGHGRVHPVKPGQGNKHARRGHRGHHVKHQKPAHPAHPSHPTPTAQPGHSQHSSG
jgi:hypothetical protein